MKKIILFYLIVFSTKLFSQDAPKIILEGSRQLKLVSLKINVEITGNFATTTYDMKFFNELDQTLEGELAFPLGEGQSVSRFAMDVNNKLREAVIVEKELARVAFESTVKQTIDPGLLEKTQGNNYKARIYPILPKKNKHVIIAYEQELYTSNNFQSYELPLGIKENLDEFSINIDIYGLKNAPNFKNNPYQNLFFKGNNNNYHLEITKKNHTPNNSIIIRIPNPSEKELVLTYDDYFYLSKTLNPNSRIKEKPKKVTLLWDTSYSLKHRDLGEELKLLKNYFEYLQNVEVQFISFSNAIHQNKTIAVNNGNWKDLEQLIKNSNYDGGTAFSLFNKLKIKTDETLLFTDGLANLGNFDSRNNKAIYTINSTVSANHETLKNIANNSGGSYINLIRLSYVDALKILKEETFQFLGIKNSDSVKEVYPNKNTNVTTGFSIAGRFSKNTSIELLFGYRGKVTKRVEIPIKKLNKTTLVKRLWGKQKLQFLNKNKELNKTAIISLAKQYHLVTDYTSMLILDRIEDYVRYRIEPPQELKQEYKLLIKNKEEEDAFMQSELKERKDQLLEDYADILEWYDSKFKEKKDKQEISSADQSSNNTVSNTNQQATNPISSTHNEPLHLDQTKRIVSGTIVDSNGEVLPGVTILIKGTSSGTATDFDGNFSINAKENDELEFSYVGFSGKSITIGNSNNLNISLEEDLSALDEVIIVGYTTQKSMEVTGSIVTIESEVLSGQVSGVNITSAPDISTPQTIRGFTFSSNSEPLYIVDGVIATNNPTVNLKPEEIDTIQVLNANNASKIYGARAANGIVIVTTKKGKETNKEAINALNKQISEKIELKSWNPDTPYIQILEKETTINAAYKKYLEIRDDYSNSPSFYLDVADFFDKKNTQQLAITILTNLIEVDLDNYELMKALAYKLEYFKQYDLAVIVYKKVLQLRPEEPQSYRDLALAYEMTGEIQKSFDLLYDIYSGELLEKDEDELYYGIEHITYVELSRLVSKYEKKLKLTNTQKNSFSKIPLDVRIVVDWNHNDTDIDLWVTDPNNEVASYKNTETKIGGHMSEDLIDGYGPEEFMLKKALKGEYKVTIDYYSDSVQKISGPTILKVTLFTNYGKDNEVKKNIIVRLDKEEDEIEIGSLKFN